MTAADLEPDAKVEQCAQFLAITEPRDRPKPLIPGLREMFNLTPVETCEAIALSHDLRRAAQ